MIIGSGAAGIGAVESIRKQDPGGEIILISEERYGYYSRPGLAYYLTGELNGKQLFPFNDRDFQQLGVRRHQARVVKIHPAHHLVELQDGSCLGYDRLLISTGARAARSRVSGSELNGVVKLDSMDDARRILSKSKRRQVAVVVGGGITALELAEGLVANNVRTHYFLRKDRYWQNVLDETESRIVEGRLMEHGVRIHHNTDLVEIMEKKGNVCGVRTEDGRVFHCSMVAVAIGVRPRIEIARGSGLKVERGILVNEYLHTDQEDIFAAGDVAQVYDPFTGLSIVDSLWGPARAQGLVAGLNMAGVQTVYAKPVAFNVTRLAGLTTTIIGTVGKGPDDDLIGIARGDSETWRQLPDAIIAQQGFEVNRLRIMIGERTILGAIIMGDQTLSRPLYALINQGVDITSICPRLLNCDESLADLIAEFYMNWKNQHAPQYA